MSLLKKKKLQVLKQNLRTKHGTVDFLALDGTTIVLVKACSTDTERKGSIIEAIDVSDREKYILLLHELMSIYKTKCARVDLALVSKSPEIPKSKYYKGIIEFNG